MASHKDLNRMDAIFNEQADKQHALTRMRWIATALFLAVTVIYLLARTFERHYPALAIVAAFAEAAMIGALADWFAVVALFRHPLGLPIPHTAIIPRNKARLAQNLGSFIAGNFLGTVTILERIRAFDPAARLTAWLVKRECAEMLSDYAARGMLFWLDAVEDTRVQRFVQDVVTGRLKSLDLARLSGELLDVLTRQGRHQQVLDRLLKTTRILLRSRATRSLVAELIEKNLNAVLRTFNFKNVIGHYVARKLVVGLAVFLKEVAADGQHPFRRKFDELVHDLIDKLKTDPQYRLKGAQIRDQILASPEVAEYLRNIWLQLRDWLRGDLAGGDSNIRAQITAALLDFGSRLKSNREMQQWINETIERLASALVERNREKVGRFIAEQVGAWDDSHMVRQVELNIGRDLQFIRINGTVVGGLVGVLIFGVNRLLAG
jgi:uncharacterized membrane-anchored protein YjiN (DUF445 family)